jgi:hypothetical protein
MSNTKKTNKVVKRTKRYVQEMKEVEFVDKRGNIRYELRPVRPDHEDGRRHVHVRTLLRGQSLLRSPKSWNNCGRLQILNILSTDIYGHSH